MILTVASGKGGTGKTTVAVNLALSIGESRVLDCDVEEPNVHTLLHPEEIKSETVFLPTPVVDKDKCTLSGKCGEFCQFNAIFVGKKDVLIYNELCHSCGGCKIVCPEGAISEVGRPVGQTYEADVQEHHLVYGELKIGEPIATSIIGAVKEHIDKDSVNILDAPPGTACPVVETMQDSDFLILVTEPTPFGLHDLSMAVDVVRELDIPLGVIINRAGIGDDAVNKYCAENDIPILLEIPFNREIAELYSRGVPFVLEMPEWKERFMDMYSEIRRIIDEHK
ncbi:(4Fe-4S)-binding protein [Candidatus Thorarchaeota archaeon]|nr:MAG: (4Fe-4S)-binding protein [Candidatus Thorarchaeota archaeon]